MCCTYQAQHRKRLLLHIQLVSEFGSKQPSNIRRTFQSHLESGKEKAGVVWFSRLKSLLFFTFRVCKDELIGDTRGTCRTEC